MTDEEIKADAEKCSLIPQDNIPCVWDSVDENGEVFIRCQYCKYQSKNFKKLKGE